MHFIFQQTVKFKPKKNVVIKNIFKISNKIRLRAAPYKISFKRIYLIKSGLISQGMILIFSKVMSLHIFLQDYIEM